MVFFIFRFLVLSMLAHRHGLLGHLNRTEQSLMYNIDAFPTTMSQNVS